MAAELDAAPVAEVPLAIPEVVFVAELAVADAPVDAAVEAPVEAEAEPVVVALAPERSSRPAVIVTGSRLSEMSLITSVEVPGNFASGPAKASTQVAVSDAMAQVKSAVLYIFEKRLVKPSLSARTTLQ